MEELKENVKRLVSLDEEEQRQKQIMSRIKSEKDAIHSAMIKFMEENNITEKGILFGDKKIEYGNARNYSGITKTLINEKLSSYFSNSETAEKVTQMIYDGRKCDLKPYIKVTDIKK
jgi:hypothetical protein